MNCLNKKFKRYFNFCKEIIQILIPNEDNIRIFMIAGFISLYIVINTITYVITGFFSIKITEFIVKFIIKNRLLSTFFFPSFIKKKLKK